MNDDIGKRAEKKLKEWLDRPDKGWCFYRIPDQMTGWYGSNNPCDFIFYRYPNIIFLESKATYHDRFDFSSITDYQRSELTKKSTIGGVYGYVAVLFATHRRAFFFDIRDINKMWDEGHKSVNVNNVKNWTIPYREIEMEENSRKLIPDYKGEFQLIHS